jgi:hypothetical protein
MNRYIPIWSIASLHPGRRANHAPQRVLADKHLAWCSGGRRRVPSTLRSGSAMEDGEDGQAGLLSWGH